MKKLLAIVLGITLVLGSFAACGSSTATSGASKESSQPASANASNASASQGSGEKSDLAADYAKINNEADTGYVDYDTFTVGTVPEGLKIGIAVGTMGSGYFKTIPDAAQEELESYGVEVLVADSQQDMAKQVNQIENFLTQGVDGILINCVDPPSAVSSVLEKATQQGVPIVAMDSRLDAEYHDYLGMVGSDNEALGFAVGEYMANAMKEKKGAVEGTIGVLDGVEGNMVAKARYDGLWKGIESVDPNHKITEVSHLYGGAWTEEAGIQMAENMLVANPELDLIFGISDPFVVGATAAANRVNRTGIIMGAVDGAKSALKIVKDGGPVEVIAGQDPAGMGIIGSRMLLSYITEGKTPEYRIMKIAPVVSTAANIEETYNPDSPF